jgi:hypothetical protein
MWPEYPSCSGTLMGEVRNEIYNRYGQKAMETAIYDWHSTNIDELTLKMYNLVNTNPRQFLISTVTFYPKVFPKAATNHFVQSDMAALNTIHLEWVTTDIDFLPKYVLDSQGISYSF